MEQGTKLIISHRANINGPNTAVKGENHPDSIQYVLDMGLSCEIDVRWVEGQGFFLGHDKPEYLVDINFFKNHKLFIHCKDVLTLCKLDPRPKIFIKLFFHQQDDIALIINSDLLWTFPKSEIPLTSRSIAVLPELVKDWKGLDICAGICTDYPIGHLK